MRRWQISMRALRLLWRYPLRSALLMLSATLGVSGVVCSVNYGASGTKQVLDQIHKMGTNVLIVMPAQSRAGRARTGTAVTTLVERDYIAIKRELLTRTRSSALVSQGFWNKAGDLSKNTEVVGCEPDYFVIKNWPVASGELFDPVQELTAARVALLVRPYSSIGLVRCPISCRAADVDKPRAVHSRWGFDRAWSGAGH